MDRLTRELKGAVVAQVAVLKDEKHSLFALSRTSHEMRALALPHIFRKLGIACPHTSRAQVKRILANANHFAQHLTTFTLELDYPISDEEGCRERDFLLVLQRCCGRVTSFILSVLEDSFEFTPGVETFYRATTSMISRCMPKLSSLKLWIQSVFELVVLEAFLKKQTAQTLDLQWVTGDFDRQVQKMLLASNSLVDLTYVNCNVDASSLAYNASSALRKIALKTPYGPSGQLGPFIKKFKRLTHLTLALSFNTRIPGLGLDVSGPTHITLEHDRVEHLGFTWSESAGSAPISFSFNFPRIRSVHLWLTSSQLSDLGTIIERSAWEVSDPVIRLTPMAEFGNERHEWAAEDRARIITLGSENHVNIVLCNGDSGAPNKF